MDKQEVKNCQNCYKDFIIEPEDFNFYEKMKVPAPTWCPECRLVRRLASVNTWSLHWATCEKCEKRTLSIFNPRKNVRIFCPPCWWSDSWDGTEYGMDYESSKPFLEQVDELARKTPWVATESLYTSLKNSEYSNGIAWSKDCYMAFWADFCESVYYSSILNGLKYSSDCLRGWKSELCYESIGFINNYRVFFSDECNECVDVWFSRNCYSCTNCFGCVNLKRKSYCILNKQYSKGEYEKLKATIIQDMKTRPYADKLGREFSYGEFFPPEMSRFDYNESNAMRFFPKTKEEVLSMGYSWNDTESSIHQTDTKSEDLPDTIKETTDSILGKIVECANCKKGYKIVKGELNLLRKMGLPVPHECPKCRENERFARMTRPGMYHRECMKCGDPIYTPYSPEDPRIVYCVKDYQALFL